jgi:hypothetical protein
MSGSGAARSTSVAERRFTDKADRTPSPINADISQHR